jgi:hypothetical protein
VHTDNRRDICRVHGASSRINRGASMGVGGTMLSPGRNGIEAGIFAYVLGLCFQ